MDLFELLGGIAGRAPLWIVLFPLLGALINAIGGRTASKEMVGGVAVGSVAVSFVLATIVFVTLLSAGETGPTSIVQDVYEWFRVDFYDNEIPIHVRFVADHLSGLMAVMV